MASRRDRQRVPPVLSAEVAERWGNECWLNMPGCTHRSDTTDHIVPFAVGGPTVVGNLRRACKHCNSLRSDRTLSGYGASIHAVIGPPAGGKSTYVDLHCQPGAVVLDFDAMARAMMPGMGDEHVLQDWVRRAASGAWYGAYRHLARVCEPVEVWLVKTLPSTPHSPRLLDEWIALDYDIVVCDPGKREVVDRLKARGVDVGHRLQAGVTQWYRRGITQSAIDARLKARRLRLVQLGLMSDADNGANASVGGRPRW